jgi:pimeloyl-ACP methyl ester carboxylesterase
MQCRVGDVTINYVEHGSGIPLVALHGAGVDHREIEAAIEAVLPSTGYRRIYPDLPGMGRTTSDGLTSNADVVNVLGEFLEHVGAAPAFLLGHSYGAYLARGVAARRPDLLLGLALLCPLAAQTGEVPEHDMVYEDADAYDELEPDQRSGFGDYFVVRTAATARQYKDVVVPGTKLVDESALGRIFSGWQLDTSGTFSAPTMIIVGRRDSTVGYRDAIDLLDTYPHASLTVVEGAGHALMHERPELLAGLLADWLCRA